MSQNNEELKHYGVLGMKWGKRRAVPQSVINRRNKQHKKVEFLEKRAPWSATYSKAVIKEAKLKRSRYGKTNGKIIAEGVLRDAGIWLIAGGTAGALEAKGKIAASKAISAIGDMAWYGSMAYTTGQLLTNYRNKPINDKQNR